MGSERGVCGVEGMWSGGLQDGGGTSQSQGDASGRRVWTGNLRLGQVRVLWADRLQTMHTWSLGQDVLVQSLCQDQASQMSARAMDCEGLGIEDLGNGLESLGLFSDNKAVGMRNGCLNDSKDPPHFMRPNSIDHSTL